MPHRSHRHRLIESSPRRKIIGPIPVLHVTKPGRGKEGDLAQDFTLRLRQSRLEAGQSQRNPMTIHCHGTKPPLPSLRWKRRAGPPRSSSRRHRSRPEETCCPRLCQQPPSPVPAGGPSLGRQSSDGPGTRELLTSPPPASTQSAPSALTGRRFHEHAFLCLSCFWGGM